MFNDFKKEVQAQMDLMLSQGQKLYVVDVDKDAVWDAYLTSFHETVRQEHNCNCCRHFLKNYAGVVAIVGNKRISIWDFECTTPEYKASVDALRALVSDCKIRDFFFTDTAKLGVDHNHQLLDDTAEMKTITWHHLFYLLPKQMVTRLDARASLDSMRSVRRDAKHVLKRSLEELTLDAVDTVLELIAQNSLYRGAESKDALTEFRKIKAVYMILNEDERDNFCWENHQSFVSRMRNTAMGTLLTDLSNGVDLDEAVTAFERIMAPANYKRPTAIITKKMVEDAELTLKELGLVDSLGRRFAVPEDISVNDVLFVDRNTSQPMSSSGVLGDLKDAVAERVNPKQLSKVAEVTIDEFLKDVLPTATSLEVMMENQHTGNLVSLVAPKERNAESLFKWDNGFSWSYNGGVADSMKERVKAAGGNVTGVLRFSLQWNEDGKSIVDLDLHAQEPGGTHIFYGSSYRRDHGGRDSMTAMGGQLDVDMINPREVGIENIYWGDRTKMRDGIYKVWVHNYNGNHNDGFTVQVEFDGEIHDFHYNKQCQGSVPVAEVHLQKGVFSIHPALDSTSRINSKQIWGIETNKFQKVSMIVKSPNFWGDNRVGNEHTFFIVEGAHNDEPNVRGFYNEFLKNDLTKHKRVFEALGGKMKVEPAEKQVSGLGFSSTTGGHLICRVGGSFSRTLKIKF